MIAETDLGRTQWHQVGDLVALMLQLVNTRALWRFGPPQNTPQGNVMQLSAHFTLEELTASATARERGIDNSLPKEFLPRLIGVAEMLERIRATLRVPLVVSSGYRCDALNRAVGSKPTSDHLQARAADFVAPQFGTPTAIATALVPLVSTLSIGQLILEGVKGRQWVHVSTRVPELYTNRILTITDAGPVAGIHPLA
jgi:zinc D-Ala-D-Ala carboxypeptidase